MDFLLKLEESGFSRWVREADSLFAFPGILLVHTIGMGLVVGINSMLNFRILGFAPAIRLRGLEKFYPLMWIGFWLNAITGTILLAANATGLMANPDFYVKLAFIALAVTNVIVLRKNVFQGEGEPSPGSKAKVLAVTSMIFWLGAIISGRLLAYVGRNILF